MSISIEDFNSQFLIHIRGLARPHIDDTGIIPAEVGLNVVCIANNRVQYFEHHFTNQALVDESTDQDLIDLAWDALASDVHVWANNVINETNLIGYMYIPTSEFNNTYDNLNLMGYKLNYITKLDRFEIYPPNEPNSWCVGFSIRNKHTNDYMYVYTYVNVTTFAITSAENDIMNEAWDKVKDNIGAWASSKIGLPGLLNTIYKPESF